MDEHLAIEKFTRCPGCRSFSLKRSDPDETGKKAGLFSDTIFVCNNCGNRYALKGNTLKETAGLLPEREQKTKKEPRKLKSKTTRRIAVFLLLFLGLLAVVITLQLQTRKQDEQQIEPAQPQVEKKEEVKKEERKEEKPEAEVPEVPTTSNSSEPTAYKIFDLSWLKVRRSSPGFSKESLRWYFSRRRITVKRAKTQRVYIAGDPAGKKKWAVDDEIVIDGQRIKGFSREMTKVGYIPESSQLPPHDITHLVPANRDTVLDIKLADYGVVWGNTSLYIVIL